MNPEKQPTAAMFPGKLPGGSCKCKARGTAELSRWPLVSPRNLRMWGKLACFGRRCVRILPTESSAQKLQTDQCHVSMLCVQMFSLYAEIYLGVCDVLAHDL